MRKKILLIISLVMFCSISFAQRAKIVTEPVSPHQLEEYGLNTNSVSTGLDVVANGTYVYLSAHNIANTQPVTAAAFEFVSKPAGSAAVFETFNTTWSMFKPDAKGTYVVKLTITTSAGTDDTTKTIYAADWVGVGNYEGVPAGYPNCMTCHQYNPKFQDIFNRWSVSGHATIFKNQINTSTHYSTSCMKCHTIGYDHNLVSDNHGFDDVAANLGWQWDGHSNPAKWDSLETFYPGLVNFATIGCENCHGPGSEHTIGTNPNKIDITLEAGVCAQCHDEPWRHNKYREFENSVHSEAIWSNSFAQSSGQNNSLSNCIRCHDAKGYVNFTNGKTTNTTGMLAADHVAITCQTCHDPHGNDNVASLRYTPEGSDTLGNGVQYTLGGTGQVCMNCHKARRDNVAYTQPNITSGTWGPHHSVQADVLWGENAAQFGSPYLSSPHKFALANACVDCHMVATADTGTVNRDKVGGHSFSLHNAESGYDHTTACVKCHGERTSFEDFTARSDYDEDGTVEPVRNEIEGLVGILRNWLPPRGVDSVSWQAIRDSNSLDLRKAFWNYQLISYDGSGGMHNTMYAIDVLRKTIQGIGGPLTSIRLDDVENPESFELSQNYPNPFNPTTTIRYSIPFESQVKVVVYSLTGEQVREIVNRVQTTGVYETLFSTHSAGKELSSGVYFYSIEAKSLDGSKTFRETKKMILMK